MSRGWLALIVLSGCTVSLDQPVALWVEPAQLDLDLALDVPQQISLHAYRYEREATADATFTLDGAAVGELVGPQLMTSARVGGLATITVAIDHLSVTVPVHVHIHSTRVVAGTPGDAISSFAAATDVAYDAALEPGDLAVIPPNLGGFEATFAAEDSDDTHEVAVTSEFLDIRIFAPGTAGPREVAFTAAEWDAIGRTSRGASADLVVRSLAAAAPATARASSSHLAFSDLDVTGGLLVGIATGASASLYHYDFASATMATWTTGPQGACVGCHVAVSRDGSRIAAATADMVNSKGLIFDTTSRQILNTPDPANTWTSAVWDPSGALITTYGGMTLRDGTTAAPLAQISTTTSPTLPIVSPDGASLAYATHDTGDSTVGKELLIHSWSAATHTLGPPTILIPADGRGIKEPSFSDDGAWILYSRTTDLGPRGNWDGAAITRADGNATYPLSTGPTDSLARWVGGFGSARVGGAAPEPMGWIVIASHRAIGAATPSTTKQLWLLAFYPDRGVFSRPFLLPGQDHAVSVLHAPRHVPF